jgi:hypothetical protein
MLIVQVSIFSVVDRFGRRERVQIGVGEPFMTRGVAGRCGACGLNRGRSGILANWSSDHFRSWRGCGVTLALEDPARSMNEHQNCCW